MGKTQLALKFAKDNEESFSSVFWLRARNEQSVRESIVGMMRQVTPAATAQSLQDTREEDRLIEGAKLWISKAENREWLLIFDNNDEPLIKGRESEDSYDLGQYLPHAFQGSILITTRSERVQYGNTVHLKSLDPEGEGLDALLTRANRKGSREGIKGFALRIVHD